MAKGHFTSPSPSRDALSTPSIVGYPEDLKIDMFQKAHHPRPLTVLLDRTRKTVQLAQQSTPHGTV